MNKLPYAMLIVVLFSCSEDEPTQEIEEQNEYITLLTSKTWELVRIEASEFGDVNGGCSNRFTDGSFGEVAFTENGRYEYTFTDRGETHSGSGSYKLKDNTDDQIVTSGVLFEDSACIDDLDLEDETVYIIDEGMELTGFSGDVIMDIYLR